MSVQLPSQYPIVTPMTVGLTIGTVCYMQTGIYGTPIGLLIALTNTPRYKKVLLTANGFKEIE